MTGQALQSASHCRRRSRVVAKSSRVVAKNSRVVAKASINKLNLLLNRKSLTAPR